MNSQSSQAADPAELTVVLTTFKRQHLLPRALNSVTRQASDDYSIEILVCDDDPGQSAKQTVEAALATKNTVIRYISRQPQSPGGVSASRNRGISEARGKYIIFLDDDDELIPFSIEKILNEANEKKADICVAILYENLQAIIL